jgi:predicted nucleic acid-binding protein
MIYVLDSSVAFKWLIAEPDSPNALRLLDDFRSGVHKLFAPDILPIEVGHALTRAERNGRISPTIGYGLWASMMTDCPQLFPSLPLMPQAYALSSQMRVGIYDCLYVALAEQEQCELVTADNRLINTFRGRVAFRALSTF